MRDEEEEEDKEEEKEVMKWGEERHTHHRSFIHERREKMR